MNNITFVWFLLLFMYESRHVAVITHAVVTEVCSSYANNHLYLTKYTFASDHSTCNRSFLRRQYIALHLYVPDVILYNFFQWHSPHWSLGIVSRFVTLNTRLQAITDAKCAQSNNSLINKYQLIEADWKPLVTSTITLICHVTLRTRRYMSFRVR